MTGSFFQTTPEAMVGVATDCDSTAAEFDSQFNELQSYCQSLQGPWLGPCATTFDALMKQWDVHAKNLNTALRGIAQGLRTNSQAYVDDETFNNQEINKANELLPTPGNSYPTNLN